MSRKIPDSEFMQLRDIKSNSDVERIASLFSPSEFRDRTVDLMTGGVNRDSFKPFWDQWGDKFVLRPKELTIWFGARGSYKSTVLNYLVADWIMHTNHKAGLISYEMDSEDLILMLAHQMANSQKISMEYLNIVMDKIENRLILIDEMVDTPNASIAKINAMLQDGCKLVVLDCLQRINMPSNDIDLERQFVVQVTNLVREHNAHAIIVHHSRKGSHSDGDNPRPVVDDLKGSGGLADNAHNVVACWSNKVKKDLEIKIAEGYRADEDELEILERPCVEMLIKKQRKQPFEGTIGLWRTDARAFHRKGREVFVL